MRRGQALKSIQMREAGNNLDFLGEMRDFG